jgi:hypothetical protein
MPNDRTTEQLLDIIHISRMLFAPGQLLLESIAGLQLSIYIVADGPSVNHGNLFFIFRFLKTTFYNNGFRVVL